MRSYIAINGGNVCFVAGTLVSTEEGQIPIEDIEPGMLVWATDPITGETALKPVVQTFVNQTNELVNMLMFFISTDNNGDAFSKVFVKK